MPRPRMSEAQRVDIAIGASRASRRRIAARGAASRQETSALIAQSRAQLAVPRVWSHPTQTGASARRTLYNRTGGSAGRTPYRRALSGPPPVEPANPSNYHPLARNLMTEFNEAAADTGAGVYPQGYMAPSPRTTGVSTPEAGRLGMLQTAEGQSVGMTSSAGPSLMRRAFTPISLNAKQIAGTGALVALPSVAYDTYQGGKAGGARGARKAFLRSAADAAYNVAGGTAGAVAGGALGGPVGAFGGGVAGGAAGLAAGHALERAAKRAFSRGKGRKIGGGGGGGEKEPKPAPEPTPSPQPGPTPVVTGPGTGPGPQQPFVSSLMQGNQAWMDDLAPSGAPLVAKPQRGHIRIAALAPQVRVQKGVGRFAIDPNSGLPFASVTKRAANSLRHPAPWRSAQLVY